MNIQQISILNDYENFNNNFSFNLFPKLRLFEPDYTKEIFVQKDFQERNEYFLPTQKINFDPIMESSQLGSTQESPQSQTKSISLNNSSDEISQNKTKNSPIFQTDITRENDIPKKFEDKLLMNRISARKSRLKKKQYIKCLEEETARLKNQILLNEKIGNNMKNLNISEYNGNEKNTNFLNKMILL